MTGPTKAKHSAEQRDSGDKSRGPNEGEGNKTADRKYRQATEKFVKSGRVSAQARKAADALEGPEGEALREAEAKGRRGRT